MTEFHSLMNTPLGPGEIGPERGEDFSRSYRNEVMDPYYKSGSDPSEPPSSGNSLDSFI